MGADGHIKIFSIEKLKNRYRKKEDVEEFLAFVKSSTCYVQSLENREYLTRYWGDNLWSEDLWDTIVEFYNLEEDRWTEEAGNWNISYIRDTYPPDKVQFFAHMIRFMEAECCLSRWEVWT